MLAFMANIPLRLAHCRENPYLLLTDWLPEPEPDRLIRHEVRRQLDLVASVEYETATESLSLWVPPESQATAIAALEAAGVHPGDRFVVLHPGASAPSRRYPAKQFGAAAAALQRDAFPVVITGDTSEIELCEEVRQAAGTGSISLAGRLSLGELAAVINEATLLIASNTGPVHIAAAVGTPVVDLYALTNPQHTPWGVPNRVLNRDVPCRHCYKSVCPEGHQSCLRGVTPIEVVEAARQLLTPQPLEARGRNNLVAK